MRCSGESLGAAGGLGATRLDQRHARDALALRSPGRFGSHWRGRGLLTRHDVVAEGHRDPWSGADPDGCPLVETGTTGPQDAAGRKAARRKAAGLWATRHGSPR